LFQVIMVLLLAWGGMCLLFPGELLSLLQSYGMSRADAFLSAEILLFAMLMFWTFNAGDAYHAATNGRRVPFRGIENRFVPLLCSLLVPGWGQFMNGQPVKGSMLSAFTVVGLFSLVTVPAALALWPVLEISESRIIIEAIFTASVLYLPVMPLVWLLSSYDALRVSLDESKKETLLDRLLLWLSRLQMHGWVRVMFPQVRSGLLFGILLSGLVLAVNSIYAPADYLYVQLSGVQAWLHQRGMTVVPDIISRLLT
jgi:hypothetical protein